MILKSSKSVFAIGLCSTHFFQKCVLHNPFYVDKSAICLHKYRYRRKCVNAAKCGRFDGSISTIEATWLSRSGRRCRTPVSVYDRASPALRRVYAQIATGGSSSHSRKGVPWRALEKERRYGRAVCIT